MMFGAIKRARFRTLRALSVTTAALLLTGCMTSSVPAISAENAQDVGPQLQYWTYSKNSLSEDGQRQKKLLVRFVRGDGVDYQMQMIENLSEAETVADGVFLRRHGSRDGTPVYLVQIDTTRFEFDDGRPPPGESWLKVIHYVLYLVAIDSEGFGTVARIKPWDKDVRTVADRHGIELGEWPCENGSCTYLAGQPEEAQIWGFLQDLLGNGLLEWEDVTGKGVLD